jgi:hypothetical protein
MWLLSREELMGPRRDEFEASRKRLGITREAAWHQETPNGTAAVVHLEADDLGTASRNPRPHRGRFHL